MTPFESWYNGIVGFHINSERILDDLQPGQVHGYAELNPNKLRKWMAVCWNNAIDASLDALTRSTLEETDKWKALEKLKENP